MSKYYKKELPTDIINVVYGGRQSGKIYYEFNKPKSRIKELEEENEKLNELVQFNVKTTAILTKRINKAIEYIEEHIKYECDAIYCNCKFYSHHLYNDFKKEDLLKILKGEE